jgi:hypothetical protein
VGGPELLGVHPQHPDTHYRRQRACTRRPLLSQAGPRRDARHGPAAVSARLEHRVPAASQLETAHHRDLLYLEQHADGLATQMVQTPGRRPVRQIVQRHNRDCTGAEHTGSDIRLPGISGPSRRSVLPASRNSAQFQPSRTENAQAIVSALSRTQSC